MTPRQTLHLAHPRMTVVQDHNQLGPEGRRDHHSAAPKDAAIMQTQFVAPSVVGQHVVVGRGRLRPAILQTSEHPREHRIPAGADADVVNIHGVRHVVQHARHVTRNGNAGRSDGQGQAAEAVRVAD